MSAATARQLYSPDDTQPIDVEAIRLALQSTCLCCGHRAFDCPCEVNILNGHDSETGAWQMRWCAMHRCLA